MSSIKIICEDGFLNVNSVLLEYACIFWPNCYFDNLKKEHGKLLDEIVVLNGTHLITIDLLKKLMRYIEMCLQDFSLKERIDYSIKFLGKIDQHSLGIYFPTYDTKYRETLKRIFNANLEEIFSIISRLRAKKIIVKYNGIIELYDYHGTKKSWYYLNENSNTQHKISFMEAIILNILDTHSKTQKCYRKPFAKSIKSIKPSPDSKEIFFDIFNSSKLAQSIKNEEFLRIMDTDYGVVYEKQEM